MSWQGKLSLDYRRADGRTIVHDRHDGPLRVLKSLHPEDPRICSWVDILALQRTFLGRAPFMRFFIKEKLIFFPIVGQACWALEFPFMKRYSREYLERHPEKRGTDLETTREACERYRHFPVSVLNFVEGSRFDWKKHHSQNSPFRHLLRPRAGGIGFVLASLGDQLDATFDVTIAYPDGEITMWKFVCGAVPRVVVRVRRIDVPREFLSPAITEIGPQRDRLQIIVASDHGHATVNRVFSVANAIAGLSAFKGATLIPGTSGSIWVPDGDLAQVSALAEWLMRQDWTGCVFAADGAIPPGALPTTALLADHPRGAPLIYTMRGEAGPARSGLPGTTLYDGNLAIGAGTHGGLSAAELHTVLIMAGSRILPGGVSEWPAGLADIAPTILALLDSPGAAEMDGRCLSEAIIGAHGPAIAPAVETWEGAEAGYAQRLARTRLGRQVYLDVGMRE